MSREAALDRIARLAARALGVPVVVVTVAEGGGQRVAGRGGPAPALADSVPVALCGEAAERGEPVLVPGDGPDTTLHGGAAAFAAVPLPAGGGPSPGCVAALDARPRGWSDADVEALRDFAALAAREVEASREGRLRRAERLASLGTLLGGVAHELNNPLAAIKSFAQLLLMDERPPEDQEALEVIEREAARAAKIVADLRLVARQTERSGGAREPVQLNDVVRGVLEIRGYTLQTHNVELRADLARDLPPVYADRGDMEQVVLNLVLNAEHSLADHPGERRLIVRTRPSALGVSLQVVDSGPGIPGEHLERIFDPFWTTKEPGQGTGLGLSLVHGIVVEHGGEIRVDSEPGRGAAFAVDLPRTPGSAGRGASPQATRPLRVLVVDDEAPIRRSLARFLERRGHRVDEAADGREALALIGDAAHARYDVILADLRMPGLSGDRLLAELRAGGTGAEERLVFITGDALGEAAAAGIAAAGVPVVFKPFELEQVARAVERRAGRGTQERGGSI
ncbi:MAG: ATP-binding protein [Gemmatimonadota bacterium]